MEAKWHATLGARYQGEGRCRFTAWAPKAEQMQIHVLRPEERLLEMQPRPHGYWIAEAEDIAPGARYFLRLNGALDLPDPASYSQPDGVHGPSEVIDPHFDWSDRHWTGISLREYVIYELHVGTYTPEGTFEAVIPFLPELRELGITAIELLPVHQCPGRRNWGYDGIQMFAAQNSYGGPRGLKTLVDACHREGLAVILDVVHNHFGPEGNFASHFAPYETDRYKMMWGLALNFDGKHSDGVRRYFLENGLYWLSECHVDALRMDAVQSIFDTSAVHYLAQLSEAVEELRDRTGRRIWTVGESDLNDVKLIRPREIGGYGMDAQWLDDFHHVLHTLVTGDLKGYLCDFGRMEQLAKAYREGFIYTGEYSPHRQCRHGNSSANVPTYKFVVHIQNHDQVGNQMGRRLNTMTDWAGIKLAAGAVLLSPYLPLIFMGEEYGETAPFHYFVNHSDPELIEKVRQGRAAECEAFGCDENVDPESEQAFQECKLNHELKKQEPHRLQWEFYRELIRLRKTLPALAELKRDQIEVTHLDEEQVLLIYRWEEEHDVLMIFGFHTEETHPRLPVPPGRWRRRMDSADPRWGGAGSPAPETFESDGRLALPLAPRAFVVYEKEAVA